MLTFNHTEAQEDAELIIPERSPVIAGEAFIAVQFEPGNHLTGFYISQLGNHLGLLPSGRPTSDQKIIRCLSDVLVALSISESGLICWPMNKADFTDRAYSRDIASKVRNALVSRGHLHKLQEPRWGISESRATVYKIDKFLCPSCLRFKEHGIGPLIEVRDTKPDYYHRHGKPKGKRLKLSQFKGQCTEQQAQMKRIVQIMGEHPLTAPDGTEWSRCVRIFNDGRLDRGGRVYGGWQSRKAKERLTFTIAGEQVCEIDIKASYLFLGSRISGWTKQLPPDPYQEISFVKKDPSLRGLAKKLVSAILSKPDPVNRFPVGDLKDAKGNTISLKDQFKLPKKARTTEYTASIFKAFPFLENLRGSSGKLMFLESNLILECMDVLMKGKEPVVVYPVHDCLICKIEDKDKVLRAIRGVMVLQLGAEPTLDVEYSNRTTETSKPTSEGTVVRDFSNWFIEGNDFSLIEEFE